MLINKEHFQLALEDAASISIDELIRRTCSGRSRSYFVQKDERCLPMKAVTRLAYRNTGTDWDAPQSYEVAQTLRKWGFHVVHLLRDVEEERLRRVRKLMERLVRSCQADFRLRLLELFAHQCAISGCSVAEALDAAHIRSVKDEGIDEINNGWILRADLHRLFDRHLLSVEPSAGTVHFNAFCLQSFLALDGKEVFFPDGGPSAAAFKEHWSEFCKKRETQPT